jgi:hypothetical protein
MNENGGSPLRKVAPASAALPANDASAHLAISATSAGAAMMESPGSTAGT